MIPRINPSFGNTLKGNSSSYFIFKLFNHQNHQKNPIVENSYFLDTYIQGAYQFHPQIDIPNNSNFVTVGLFFFALFYHVGDKT